MGSKSVEAHATSTATPAAIMALLTDGATWPSWSGHDSFELVEAAPEGPKEGVGAVRIFRKGRTASTERVIEYVPERRLGYELVSGLPLANYRAYVDLTPTATGTDIHWHSSFDPKIPGTGWLYAYVLRVFIRRATESLAAKAAQ
jgi:hypothetical protein